MVQGIESMQPGLLTLRPTSEQEIQNGIMHCLPCSQTFLLAMSSQIMTWRLTINNEILALA